VNALVVITPTQEKARRRRAAFRQAIEHAAAELEAAKEPIALAPVRVEPSPPKFPPLAAPLVYPALYPADPRRLLPIPPQPRIADIQRAVANFYDVNLIDMLSARRTACIVRPRQIAMYLSKVLTLRSLPEIGRRHGDRDHTTVLHAVRKMEIRITLDPDFAREIGTLRDLITGAAQ
jgi:hypothetical protein